MRPGSIRTAAAEYWMKNNTHTSVQTWFSETKGTYAGMKVATRVLENQLCCLK